jgi:hypothetical protein
MTFMVLLRFDSPPLLFAMLPVKIQFSIVDDLQLGRFLGRFAHPSHLGMSCGRNKTLLASFDGLCLRISSGP